MVFVLIVSGKMTRSLLAVFCSLSCISVLCSAQSPARIKATKEVTGIDPNDVVVQCYPDRVKVIIEKSRLPRILSSQNLHFSNPLCVAGENGTHFIASTSFRRCGVSRKLQWNGLAYSNKLMTGFPETDKFDPRCPVVSIKFTCMQLFFAWPRPRVTRAATKSIHCEHIVALGPRIKNGIFSAMTAKSSGLRMKSRVMTCPIQIGIGPAIKQGEFARTKVKSKGILMKRTHALICRRLEGTGEHNLSLTAYADETFSTPIRGTFYSNRQNIDVFYDLKIRTADSYLTIYPKRCHATPTKDPLHETQHVIIKDGCIEDNTVQFYGSNDQSFRFSIQSFQFQGYNKTFIFMHCEVIICDAEDKESFCAKRCQAKNIRRRRGGRSKSGLVKKCAFDRIHVSFQRAFMRRAKQANLQLEDPNCVASVNETHFFFNIHRGRCGTLAKSSGSLIEISNSINYRINGKQLFSVPVKCSYTQDESIAALKALSVMHNERFISVWLGKQYHFSRKVVLDSSVSELINDMPLDIVANEANGILDFVISPKDENLEFVIDHCKIKPSPASKRKRILLENDCSRDQHVFIQKTKTTTRVSIDFKKWKSAGRRMFAKCHFTVCHRNAPASKCARKACQTPIYVLSKFARKKRSLDVDALKAVVTCSPSKIAVAIERDIIPGLHAANLHLKSELCRPRENNTHIVFEMRPNECDTSIKVLSSAVEYTNVVLGKVISAAGVIQRSNSFQLPFKCIVTASTSPKIVPRFKTKNPLIKISGIASGTFPVRLTLFTDASYQKEMNAVSARTISASSLMYFQVAMETPDASLVMSLEICYAKPLFSSDSSERYIFIRNNCALDDTVQFYKTNQQNKKRFSVAPFEFSNVLYKSVFVDCVVSACNPNDKSSPCSMICPDSYL